MLEGVLSKLQLKEENISFIDPETTLESAQEKLKVWLTAHPDVNHILIASSNDTASLGFINALETIGILDNFAIWIDSYIANKAIVATLIGLLSAVVDNVPLVAACTGMYDLGTYPPDSPLWHMIAYTAGTGGSIFIIGSAAGVAFMGIEKVDFIWYFKKISLSALIGYLAGMALYLSLRAFVV